MKIIAVTIGNRSAYFCPQLAARLILESAIVIKIFKALGQIFSLIVHGVVDRNNCAAVLIVKTFPQTVVPFSFVLKILKLR